MTANRKSLDVGFGAALGSDVNVSPSSKYSKASSFHPRDSTDTSFESHKYSQEHSRENYVHDTKPPDKDGNSPTSKRQKIRNLGHEAKVKTKRLIKRGRFNRQVQEDDEDEEALEEDPYDLIRDDPAFDPSQINGHKHMSLGKSTDKTIGNLFGGLKAIVNPGNALKRKAATTAAVGDRPYLSQEADEEFLEAHQKLYRARSSNGNSNVDQDEAEHQKRRIKDLEALRESRKVAYITSKHIKRVLVVPKREVPCPKQEDFCVVDEATGKQNFNRIDYTIARGRHFLKDLAINNMGHVDFADQPPFDIELMTRHGERILIASSPWQSWFASMRQIYRWENPSETRKYAIIWFFVWYMDYIIVSILAYVAYIVLANKFRKQGVEGMRASYERSLNQGNTAFKFNELIRKHGSDKWLDPVMNEVGPRVQTQAADLADYLERLNNFYNWKEPRKTWATLFWFLCAILLGVFTSTGYSMKIIWMFCYLYFFLCRPIASYQPEYRHVVNAVGWIFWDLPSEADDAMMYLRRNAQETRERLISREIDKKYQNDFDHPAAAYTGTSHIPDITRTGPVLDKTDLDSDSDGCSWHSADSSTSVLEGLDIMSFRCHMNDLHGRLIICSDGVRFLRSGPLASLRKEMWRQTWQEVAEVSKFDTSVLGKLHIKTGEGIAFSFTSGEKIRLEAMQKRDRAFNCIIGFSGLCFQVLQPVVENESTEKRVEEELHD